MGDDVESRVVYRLQRGEDSPDPSAACGPSTSGSH